MNREIKFRVWDKINKKFVKSGKGSYLSIDLNGKLQEEDGYGNVAILSYQSYDISQFTGLSDLNGHDIYEGDIIIFMGRWDEKGNVLEPDYQKYTVNWFMGGLHAMTIKKSLRSFHRHNEVLGVGHTNSEILGNIFENPDLLKVK